VLQASGAWAHGDHKPTHGGTVGRGGDDDIVMEFILENGTLTLYLDDESGKPIPTKNIVGTLSVVTPGQPGRDVKLVPAGDNRFTATGLETVRSGRLLARLKLPSGEQFESFYLVNK
jgi:nitrogen fixation protein FixH